MGDRALLNVQWWCPWSGFSIKGKVIEPHKLQIVQCFNKTFFAMCHLHKTRIFCNDWNTIGAVSKFATVLEVTQKPIRVRRQKDVKAH